MELVRTDRWLTLVVIDALSRAGQPAAAMRVAAARTSSLEDVPRNRSQRLFNEHIELSFRFERAVAGENQAELDTAASRWSEVELEQKAHRDEQREGDSRSGVPFSHLGG